MKKLNFIKTGVLMMVFAVPFSTFAVSATVDGSVDVNAGVEAGSTSTTSLELNSTTSTDVSAENTSSTNTEGEAMIKLEVNSSGIEIKSSGQVSSEEDLRIFGKNLAIQNKDVVEVKADSSEEIRVKYKHKGRFLGIFPVKITSTTKIDIDSDADAKVKTKMAWWNIFVTGTHDIDEEVDSKLKTSSSVSVVTDANVSSSVKAEAINAVIKAHSDVSAQSSVAVK